MKLPILIAMLTWGVELVAALNGLDLARQALRDQLWSIAETNAAEVAAQKDVDRGTRCEARLVQLEALAKSSRTSDMLARLATWKDETDERFRYWRGWAFAHAGRADEARAVLTQEFSTVELRLSAKRLAAWTSFSTGDWKSAEAGFRSVSQSCTNNPAVKIENACDWAHAQASLGGVTNAEFALNVLKQEVGDDLVGVQADGARLLKAQLLALAGRTTEAMAEYRRLIDGGTNTCAAVFVPAACEYLERQQAAGVTNDVVNIASNAVARALRPDHRLRAGMALGFVLLQDPSTRSNGLERIKGLVKENPGEAASEVAQRRLADLLLGWGDYSGAYDEYDRLMKVFPSTVSDAHVLEGAGWAALGNGKWEMAEPKFASAVQYATNQEDRARYIFKQADAKKAGGLFGEAAVLYGQVDSKSLRERARFYQADALEQSGKKKEASTIFRVLFGEGKAYAVEAGLRAAELELKAGHADQVDHLKEAVGVYGRLLKAKCDPPPTVAQRVRIFRGLGRAHYLAGDYREAEADFTAAAKLDASCRDRMEFWCVLCRYGYGDPGAIDYARKLLASAPQDQRLAVDLQYWIAQYDAEHRAWALASAGFLACASNAQMCVECSVRAARCATELSDFPQVVKIIDGAASNEVWRVAETNASHNSSWLVEGMTLQGEAMVELGRFDEALSVLGRACHLKAGTDVHNQAAFAYADALFACGADDSSRYEEALAEYAALEKEQDRSLRLRAAFMYARTLEKLNRRGEAERKYYDDVVQAYWNAVSADGREENHVWFDDSAGTLFVRAVFTLADCYESRGELTQAAKVLNYLLLANMGDQEVAKRRIARLREKGGF